jgi:hypothetical protein
VTQPARRTLSLVAMILVLAVAGAHVRVLLGATWDDARYHTEIAPPRLAAAETIRDGTWPAWWEGSGLGVPLAAEPSHGALYPPTWIAGSPRALDWLAIAHLVWLAIGVAVWARQRSPDPPRQRAWLGDASEPAAVVVAIVIATSGLATSAATRGALPALAHLPWIGAAACWLAQAESRRDRARATAALGALIGLVGLSGIAGGLVDAVALAVVLGSRRGKLAHLAIAIACGLAIAAAQWVPAVLELARADRAGAEVVGIPLSRLLELVVPLASGSPDPDRALVTLAGDHASAPSLFVGAPLLALAAIRVPSRRVLGILGVFTVLALVVGRGGWPAAFGAPELQLAALVIVLAAHAGTGLDALVAAARRTDAPNHDERRALLAFAAGTACTAISLIAIGVLRSREPSAALDRALVDGGFCVVASIAVLAIAWRGIARALPIAFALLVLPGIGSQHSTAPITDRGIVDQPPAWVEPALRTPAPRRVFRPVYMTEAPPPRANVTTPNARSLDAPPPETLDDAISTFAGTSAWKWGLGAARSEDPARSVEHDRAYARSAMAGGELLDRYGIRLAILPESLVVPRGFTSLGVRGRWALVDYPAAPAASVMRGWSRAVAIDNALALLFPPEGTPPLPRGMTILGAAGPSQPVAKIDPLPCTIDDWSAGAIDLRCTTDAPGYAVVSSSAAPGWSVTVDGADAEWVTADVVRRGVQVTAGAHVVEWRYSAPGQTIGLVLAGLGIALLIARLIASRR